MPDLSREAVKDFWQQRRDSILYRIIKNMENVETWTSDDDPALETALMTFGECLDQLTKFEVAEEDKIIRLLINIKIGRALRIMQHMDSVQPGSASKLLIYAENASKNENNQNAGFFLKRNLVFERMQLLGRIFSPDRVHLVSAALEAEMV
jgi:intracellular multiplication protein IcmW